MKLRTRISLTLAATFALAGLAYPQAMTTITATNVQAGGEPATGTLCLRAVNSQGNPISVSKSGGGFYLAGQPFCQTLISGALAGSLTVPNPVTDSTPGHPYDIQVYDTGSGQLIDLGDIYGIGGSTWSLDTYDPTVTIPTTLAFTFTQGSGVPSGACTAPALYVNSVSAALYVCAAGAWSQASGGGSVTASTVQAAIAAQSGCGTGNPWIPSTNSCPPAALVGNTLLTDPSTASLVTIGASEGLIHTSNYPEYLATDLQIPSGNQSIIQIGSASMPDVLSCATAGSGNCTQDGTLPKPWPWGITPTTKGVFGFGFNDLSNTGASPSAAQLDQMSGQDLAYLMMLAIPDAQKINASTGCTLNGSYTVLGNPTWPAGTVRFTSSGATAVCTAHVATYAGVVVYKSPTSTSQYSVTVANAGNTYNLTDSTGSPTLIQNAGAYTSAWGGTNTLYAIGQSGMLGGTTTITYTCVNPESDACVLVMPFFLNAGNNINSYPPVIQQLAPLQDAGGTCGSCISGHTDAQLAPVRQLQENAALLLRSNGLNVSYFDPNAAPNGANPNSPADMGKAYTFTVTAGGSGFTGSSATPIFTGCTIAPSGITVPVSGGSLVTGTYTNPQSGACASAPTVTFAGGTGYTATAAYTQDEVHFNEAAGQRVAQIATHYLSSAANTADHYLPSASSSSGGATSSGAAGVVQVSNGAGNLTSGIPATVTVSSASAPITVFNNAAPAVGGGIPGFASATPNIPVGSSSFLYTGLNGAASYNAALALFKNMGGSASSLNYSWYGLLHAGASPGLAVCADGSIATALDWTSTTPCPQTGGGITTPGGVIGGNAGPHQGTSQPITANGNIVVLQIASGNSAAATCEFSYPDLPGTGRIAVASFALTGFIAGGIGIAPANLLTPFGHYEYSSGNKTFGTPFMTFNSTGSGVLQLVIPIQNYVSGTEYLYGACTTDGNPNSIISVLPNVAVSGTTAALTISPAW
jgi:hypothetical protein